MSDLLAFVDRSPTPYHAVAEMEKRLRDAGFRRLDERAPWQVQAGDRVWVARGGSTLAAFVVGSEPAGVTGFRLIGAHTDSPTLRLKPQAEHAAYGYRQLGVEVYGGVLLSTWLDRDLCLAGRVHWQRPDGSIISTLLHSQKAVGRIPSLAIHLDREVNQDGLKLNAQQHMTPLVGLLEKDESRLRLELSRLAAEQGVELPAERLLDWDLSLCDAQPSAVGGLDDEFIFAPRLDNLASCHAGLTALSGSEVQPSTLGIVCYDHEECGSHSAQGAASDFLATMLSRLVAAGAADELARAKARSMFLSLDMAHGVHPNHADRHEPQHRPRLGGGPVIKRNANQAYGTDGAGAAYLRTLAAAHAIPLQHFVMRSDLRCGTTIGPIVATQLGMPTVDLGNPMLSMHSCREMAATRDVQPLIALLAAFFAALNPP